jgi:hypothetical protein
MPDALVVGLVDAFGVDVVCCDEFSVVGGDADVAVVDEEEDVAAFAGRVRCRGGGVCRRRGG